MFTALLWEFKTIHVNCCTAFNAPMNIILIQTADLMPPLQNSSITTEHQKLNQTPFTTHLIPFIHYFFFFKAIKISTSVFFLLVIKLDPNLRSPTTSPHTLHLCHSLHFVVEGILLSNRCFAYSWSRLCISRRSLQHLLLSQ